MNTGRKAHPHETRWQKETTGSGHSDRLVDSFGLVFNWACVISCRACTSSDYLDVCRGARVCSRGWSLAKTVLPQPMSFRFRTDTAVTRSSLHVCLLLCVVSTGCESRIQPGRPCVPRNRWMTASYSSADRAVLYLNSCMYLEEYPGYGIAIYTRDYTHDSRYSDRELIADSLRRVREEFGAAYANRQIVSWDNAQSREVPVDVNYVVILVDDKHPDTAGYKQAGIVLTAEQAFDDAQDVQDVINQTVIQRGDLRKDDPITLQKEREGLPVSRMTRFQIIECHMAERLGKH